MKKALLIGINYIDDSLNSLRGCFDDINNMKSILKEDYGYSEDNIIQLRDDSNKFSLKPTRENILMNLELIVQQTSFLHEIVIHYSGHGSQIPDYNNTEKDGMDEVIIPCDFKMHGFITDNEIYNIIKKSKCKTLLIFDSCHSASICDLQWLFEFNNNSALIKTLNVNRSTENPNIYCLSGCKDAETSADSFSSDYKEPMGAFTDAIIHCLKQNKFNVNIVKLYADICIYMKSEGYSQNPVLSSSSVMPSYLFIQTNNLATSSPVISTVVPANIQINSSPISNIYPKINSLSTINPIISFSNIKPNVSLMTPPIPPTKWHIDLSKKEGTSPVHFPINNINTLYKTNHKISLFDSAILTNKSANLADLNTNILPSSLFEKNKMNIPKIKNKLNLIL